MKVRYSCTYEYEWLAPVTHTGVVEGSHVAVCVSRAVRQAQRATKARGWSSFVCVLLERLPEKEDGGQEGGEPTDVVQGGQSRVSKR